jgi:mannose-6-phosphate isomerase-like protein (cupin superfamily)
MTEVASAKPVPKSPVEKVTTAWEPGERNVKRLARSELISVLHHHTDGDATWVVLEGEVTFYGEDDQVLAKAGPKEAVVVPRNTMYWFENTSKESLVMYRISAKVGGISESDDRVYHKRG